MPLLVIVGRDGSRRTVRLSRVPVTLGRADTCAVVLPHDGEVSREHARVWVDDGGRVLVEDLGSKNGTQVDNGDAFHSAVRPVRRQIRIGEYRIEITPGEDEGGESDRIRFQHDGPRDADHTRFFPSSRGLDLNQQRLTLLMSLAERIGGAFTPTQLLEQALDACCEALGFERGLIALRTARGEPELPVTRNLQRDETGAYKVSRTLINRALVEGERAVVNNPAVDLADNLTESLVRFPICSALCVPIMHRDRILGVIYGDRITRASTYTAEDVDFLAAIARQVGVGLENLRLFQAFLDGERVKVELQQARRIQEQLIPREALRRGRVVLAGHNEPSEAVGGDYFDYFELGDACIGFIIADVTGHGLPASLIMANLQAAVRVAMTAAAPLEDVAVRLNRLIVTNTDSNVFVTAILGRLDASDGAIEYVNAGHPAPVLVYRDRVESMSVGHALPLGIEDDVAFPVLHIVPTPELEAVVLYTDGLIEAPDPRGALLDVHPVIAALRDTPQRSPSSLIQTLLRRVRTHLAGADNNDDLTLLVVHYLDADGRPPAAR